MYIFFSGIINIIIITNIIEVMTKNDAPNHIQVTNTKYFSLSVLSCNKISRKYP